MLDHIRRGVVPRGATVVFVHTGGQPALFAASRALMEHMANRQAVH
jgi:1-aminocyclopropane-1-carboxylate deaminase/D-cysteine desulfhydrase-like pyridoxal-dependent ACC family enzyme